MVDMYDITFKIDPDIFIFNLSSGRNRWIFSLEQFTYDLDCKKD